MRGDIPMMAASETASRNPAAAAGLRRVNLTDGWTPGGTVGEHARECGSGHGRAYAQRDERYQS